MKIAQPPARFRQRRHGVTLIYVTFGMLAFVGFVSLAIDVAHVWVVHAELQQSADAAVRYGLTGLSTGVSTAQANAVTAAADNTADGIPVALDPTTDIDFGTWSTSSQTFTVLSGAARSGANAIRVRAGRTAATGNPVSCFFGSVIGHPSTDVHATSTGYVKPGYALVGLSGINLTGNASISSYWSPSGTNSSHGSIASNGDITVQGSASIQGDAHPGPGMSLSLSGGASVTGATTALATSMSYSNASAGTAASSNNNSAASGYWNTSTNDFSIGGSQSLTLPAGVYYFNNFSTSGQSALSFSGAATVYVTGNISLGGGGLVTAANQAKNLNFQVIGSGTVTLSGGSSAYFVLYAPQSAVTLNGSGTIYGSVLGQTVDMSGNSSISYDLSLPGAWSISMVQ
jgi:Flp pilus assembly protein TadG